MQLFVFAVAASVAQLLPRENFKFYVPVMDNMVGTKRRIIGFMPFSFVPM